MIGLTAVLPEQAAEGAFDVDLLFGYLTLIAVVFTTGIFLALIWFSYKYRRRPGNEGPPAPTRTVLSLEIAWTIVPLVLGLTMFFWGAKIFVASAQPPPDAIRIDIVGKQWMWKAYHANGRREINTLHVPRGRPVRLRMISEDVIHDFFVPAFRTKQDVLPGRYTGLWFEASRTGRYHLFCAEYCGTNHSKMIGEVVVMEPARFAEWLAGGPAKPPAEAGAELFEKIGCAACHGAKATQPGPRLEGVFGRKVQLRDGRTVTADSDYLRESIVDPLKKVVAGYEPNMPSYAGQLDEEQILQLLAYIESLTVPGETAPEENR